MDAGINTHFILLLAGDQPEDNAATLVYAYNNGWLGEQYVVGRDALRVR